MSLRSFEQALDGLEDALDRVAADTPDPSRSPRGPLAVVASPVTPRGSTADNVLFFQKQDTNPRTTTTQ